MSLSDVNQILSRIKVAPEISPIAIFRTSEEETEKLDAIFANPVASKIRIKKDAENLIGIYDNGSDAPDMEGLRGHLNIQLSVPAV